MSKRFVFEKGKLLETCIMIGISRTVRNIFQISFSVRLEIDESRIWIRVSSEKSGLGLELRNGDRTATPVTSSLEPVSCTLRVKFI